MHLAYEIFKCARDTRLGSSIVQPFVQIALNARCRLTYVFIWSSLKWESFVGSFVLHTQSQIYEQLFPRSPDERGNVVGRSRAPRNKVRDLVFLSELSGVHKGGLQLFE